MTNLRHAGAGVVAPDAATRVIAYVIGAVARPIATTNPSSYQLPTAGATLNSEFFFDGA